ncbi:MAG: Ig-like domain-containing protein [Gemmatimonadaceae bacterium]
MAERTLWCGDLLEQLRTAEHFTIGIEHYRRVEQLLDFVGPGASLDQLERLIGPIVATSAEQQERFSEIFRAYAASLTTGGGKPPKHAPLPPPPGAHTAAHAILVPTGGDRARRALRRHQTTFIAAIVAGIAAMLFAWRQAHQPVTGRVSRPDTTVVAPDTTVGVDTNVPIARARIATALLPRDDSSAAGARPSWSRREARAAQGIALALPLVILTTFLLLRRRRSRAVAERQRRVRPPYVWLVRPPDTPDGPYGTNDFFAAARALRRRQRATESRFAVERSVQATIDALGYPTFAYEAATRPPEYLVLVQRESSRDHDAALFDALARALRDADAFISRYFYENDPRVCYAEDVADGSRSFRLADLQRLHPDHRLLVFGDGAAFLDPVTARPLPWLASLEFWEERALLTPAPPTAWSAREFRIAGRMPVLPATLDGLRAMVDHLDARTKPRARTWIDRDEEPVPPEADATVPIAELRAYMGSDAMFRWLCACAVYPELHWDLTLHLGTLPEIGDRLLTEANVLRLVRLPWFRRGAIPDEARVRLLDALSAMDAMHRPRADTERAVRATIVQALEREAIDLETVAGERRARELLLQKLYLYRDEPPTRRALLRRLENVQPKDELEQDITVVRLLRTLRPSRLALVLPAAVREKIWRYGQPSGGFSNYAAGAAALLAAAFLLWIIPVPLATPAGAERLVAELQTLQLPVGAAVRLPVSALGADGAPKRDTLVVQWTSDAPGTASVSPAGDVTGIAAGRTTIVATAGRLSASTSVLVRPKDVAEPVIAWRVPHAGPVDSAVQLTSGIALQAQWMGCVSDVTLSTRGLVAAGSQGATVVEARRTPVLEYGIYYALDRSLGADGDTLLRPVRVTARGAMDAGDAALLAAEARALRRNASATLRISGIVLAESGNPLDVTDANALADTVARRMIASGAPGERLARTTTVSRCRDPLPQESAGAPVLITFRVANADTLFANYTGSWTSDDKSRFSFGLHLDQRGPNVSGFFAWRLTNAGTDSTIRPRVGDGGVEVVGGAYDAKKRELHLVGSSVNDTTLLGLGDYRITLSQDLAALAGRTYAVGNSVPGTLTGRVTSATVARIRPRVIPAATQCGGARVISGSNQLRLGESLVMRLGPSPFAAQNGRPSSAQTSQVAARVSWVSSDSSIARVSPAGIVTAVAPGSTNIYADCRTDRSLPFKLTVRAANQIVDSTAQDFVDRAYKTIAGSGLSTAAPRDSMLAMLQAGRASRAEAIGQLFVNMKSSGGSYPTAFLGALYRIVLCRDPNAGDIAKLSDLVLKDQRYVVTQTLYSPEARAGWTKCVGGQPPSPAAGR